MAARDNPQIIVVMGVSGAGKTTLASALAAHLGWPFLEADDLHPLANIARMRAGMPLDDADRAPWLDAVAGWLAAWQTAGEGGVAACSALRLRYRDRLRAAVPALRLVHLAGDPPLIAARLAARPQHFLPPSLLASQFATLEPPEPHEAAVTIACDQPLGQQLTEALAGLCLAC
jgi:gluconokinase